MKVAGFSFIRNAIKYDYPIVEAITSVLPLCDEFVIAVGQSDDDTKQLIRSIDSPKIKIIDTVWDDSLREGGRVLAEETNKALAAISSDADWAFYIQGDEVLHEDSIPAVREAMQTYLQEKQVDGLLFKYRHFYGSYQYIGDSRKWYRREIRVIRPTGHVTAYRDAQGFRTTDNKKLRVKLIDAYIHHYGWVKSVEHQRRKYAYFYRFWNSDTQMERIKTLADHFRYEDHIDSLAEFNGTHPAVMLPRINKASSSFQFDTTTKRFSPRVRLLTLIERLTGRRIGEYKNYNLLK